MTATLTKIKNRFAKTGADPVPSAVAVKARAVPLPSLPAGTPFALPPAVLRGLQQVMAKQKRVNLTECFLLLLAALAGLWLLQGLADWWFNLPWAARFFLFLADLSGVGLIGFRFGWMPWKKRLNLESAALRVEKEIPAFRTSLISSVELAAAKTGCTQGSLSLVTELLARVNQQVEKMDLARIVVKTARLKLLSRYAGLVLLIVVAVVSLTGTKSPVLLKRILLSNVPLPTRTVVISISRDESVPIGSDLTLSARAEGEKPKSGRLVIIYADKSRQEISAVPSVDAPDIYSVKLQNIQQPFQYRFVLNDGTGPDFGVEAKVSPALASFKCIQTFPTYTGIPPAEIASGNLTLLAGSKVRIEGRATQSLKNASVQMEGVSQKVDLNVGGGDRRDIQGEFVVPKEGLTGFSLPLINSEGVASVDNTIYRVELIQDKAPLVELTSPSSSRLGILSRTKPRLVYSVKDDFGLKKVVLKYELTRPAVPGGAEPPAEKGEFPVPLPPDGGAVLLNQPVIWDFSDQKPAWTEGCTVTYWIEATDNNDATGPGIGQSAKKTLAILSEEAKRAELLEIMGARATDIESVYNTQKKVNEDLDTTIRKNQP